MNEVGTLSINECDITNQDVTVTYVPQTFVTSYQYIIYKDNKEDSVRIISNNKSTNIKLSETGNYKIKIIAYHSGGHSIYQTGIYKIDKEAPVIEVDKSIVDLNPSEHYNIYSNIMVTDNVDGNLTKKVETNIDSINLHSFGKKKLIYTVTDSAGNKAEQSVILNVSYNKYFLNLNEIIIIGLLLGLLIFLLILDKAVRLEKRLVKYTVKSIKDHSESILDKIALKVRGLSYRISDSIDRFDIFRNASKRYQKYVDAFSKGNYSALDFISTKIMTSFVFLLSFIVIQTLRFKFLNIYEFFIPVIIGYYLLDIIYAYRYYKYRKKIEKDLLQAIIIMNNCFKSGRSITQAINLVAEQLDGAIADEFKKMSLEISFGLEIEVVFKRFADRIKLDEAAYLTSSLSVLNKTGGNIIKVFTSIEKTLFNRQKLNLEMKSLTGSSKVIMYVLTIMPILFVLIISFINKDYFKPLFTSTLGFIIIGIILALYILYIIVVRKIMKVRMWYSEKYNGKDLSKKRYWAY